MRTYLLALTIAAASAAAADWEALGPFGGSVSIVQVDRQEYTVLAATSNAQLFKSADDGDSWRSLPFPAQSRASLHALAIDRRNPGVYFVGLSSDISEYSGMMRTDDGGLTWRRLAEPELRNVWAIAIFAQDSQVIAAGTEDGLLLTRDGGESWAQLLSPDDQEMKPVVSLAFDAWDSNILYLGTPHLAWRTTDGGMSWNPIHTGMLDDSDVFYLLVDSQRRQRLYAATCGGIYRSVDRGEKWSKLREASGASYRVYHIAQDPLRPNILFAGTTNGLVRSMDGGATWRRLSKYSTRWVAFDIGRTGRIFVATDEAGILRSDDLGDSLEEVNRGFGNRRFVDLRLSGDDLYVSSAIFRGGSRMHYKNSTWEELPDDIFTERTEDASPSGDTADPAAERADVHDVVMTEDSGLLAASPRGLVKSDDGGITWHPVPGILDGNTVLALCRHPLRPGVFFAALNDRVYRSSDDGRSWTALVADSEIPPDFSSLAVLAGTPDRLFALSRSSGVYVLSLPSD